MLAEVASLGFVDHWPSEGLLDSPVVFREDNCGGRRERAKE
jgi:hypothetical protein